MNRYFKIFIWLVALAPLIYLALVWQNLPETIAMHFDIEGKADRYGNKKELMVMVIVLSVMCAGIFFLLSNIYKIDPKRYAAENKDRLKRMGFIISIFLSAMTCFIIYSSVHEGFEIGVRYVFAGVGLLLSVLGNYMHTIKPNYFAGFRVPWTLNNEENWRKTHLLGGKLWFVGGLFIALLCLFLPNKLAAIAFFVFITAMVLIPLVYSYRLYRADKLLNNERKQNGI
jgi:uncharacterized membrane protein